MSSLILDLLFTPICLGCKKLGDHVCRDCLNRLKIVNRHDLAGIEDLICASDYLGWLRDQVIAYKSGEYQNATGLAQVLISKCLSELPGYSLVPIPSSPEKIKNREIDTIGHITQKIQNLLPSVSVSPVLKLTKNLPDQVGLTKAQRLKNLQAAFTCIKTLTKPVILVDDVVTTGATLTSAAHTLLKCGAPKVYAVGLCATEKLS